MPRKRQPDAPIQETPRSENDLFTAPQVARLCDTDLKTIHNWVNRGEIKSFRTPGRHLRFRRQDIVEFLQKFGYPVPEGFTSGKQRLVVIDENATALRNIKRTFARDFDVESYDDHVDALLAIGRRRPSMVLVNGEQGGDAMHLVERLSINDDGAPVVVYGSETSLEKKALSAGAELYIPAKSGKEIRRGVLAVLKV